MKTPNKSPESTVDPWLADLNQVMREALNQLAEKNHWNKTKLQQKTGLVDRTFKRMMSDKRPADWKLSSVMKVCEGLEIPATALLDSAMPHDADQGDNYFRMETKDRALRHLDEYQLRRIVEIAEEWVRTRRFNSLVSAWEEIVSSDGKPED